MDEYRNRGVGTAMLQAVIDKCRPGKRCVIAKVHATNHRARRWFSRFSFHPWVEYDADGYVVMQRDARFAGDIEHA